MNGQPTAQNTRETGCNGDLPGFRNWQNEAHVAELAALWNVEPLQIPHWGPPTHAMEIFRYAEQGSIEFLWVMRHQPGGLAAGARPDPLDPLAGRSLPRRLGRVPDRDGAARRRRAAGGDLGREDRARSRTPTAPCTSPSRRSSRPARRGPTWRSSSTTRAGSTCATRTAQPLVKWSTPEECFEAWKECTRGRPCDYTGLSYDKLRGGSGIQWPCNDEAPDGTERLYEDLTFPTVPGDLRGLRPRPRRPAPRSRRRSSRRSSPQGRAILKAAEWTPPHEWARRRVPVRAHHRPHRLPLPHPHEDRPRARAAGRRARRLGRALRRGRRAARRRGGRPAARLLAARLGRGAGADRPAARGRRLRPLPLRLLGRRRRRRPRRPAARSERADDDDLGSGLQAAAAEDRRGEGREGSDEARAASRPPARARDRARGRAARGRRAPPRRPRRLPPVPHLRRHRRQARRRSSSRSPQRYDGQSEWTTAVGDGSDDLLEDLRALYLRAEEVAITWTMAAQAAKALRDQELLTLATECQSETEAQAKWFTTQDQDRRSAGARGGMTETPAESDAASELAAAHASSRCGRSQGRSRSASSGSPPRRSSCRGSSSAGSSRRRGSRSPSASSRSPCRSSSPRRSSDSSPATAWPPPEWACSAASGPPSGSSRSRASPARRATRSDSSSSSPAWRCGRRHRRPLASKLVPALVLATAGLRFLVTGLYQLTANEAWEDTAGVIGLILAGARDLRGVRRRVRGRAQATAAPARPPRQGRAGDEGNLRRADRQRRPRAGRAPTALTALSTDWYVGAGRTQISTVNLARAARSAARSMKNAPPALPGSFATNPLTVSLTCASHLSIASGEPDHVDVLANIGDLRFSTICPSSVTLARITVNGERLARNDLDRNENRDS